MCLSCKKCFDFQLKDKAETERNVTSKNSYRS